LLPKDDDLVKTMKLFREIANEVSQLAFQVREQLKGYPSLRRYCYPTLRQRYPTVNSRVLEYAIRIVAGVYSKKQRMKLKKPAEFKKDFALFDKRLFSFNGQTVKIWTVAGKKEFPFFLVSSARFLNWWERKTDIDSIILKEGNGRIIAHVCLTVPKPLPVTPRRFVGVDLGASCPLVAVRDDGKVFFPNFSEFHRKREEWFEERRYLQWKLAMQRAFRKDAHNTLRALRRLSRKQRHFTRQFVRWIVNRLLTWAGDAVIIMERLRLPQGKKVKGAKKLNRTLSLMPYGLLRNTLEQKAEELGLKVWFVDPKGTSQTCPQCGERGERPNRDLFKCPSCGFSCHADIVGAKNILRRGLQSYSQSGAEAGDKPAFRPFQPPKTCPPSAREAGTWNLTIVPPQERLQSTSKQKRATGGRLQPRLF
jgi:IS605 OrfB family transposase